MGVGIGGDYPLSTVIPSEFASTRHRGALITAVGAAQGWGAFSMTSYYLRESTDLLNDLLSWSTSRTHYYFRL